MRTAAKIRRYWETASPEECAVLLDDAIEGMEVLERDLAIERRKVECYMRMFNEVTAHLHSLVPMPSFIVVQNDGTMEPQDTYGVRAAMARLHEALERAAQGRKVTE